MESCRNVLIEFVHKEAFAQIQNLGEGIRTKYNIDEVTAYALNRLPAKFASTDIDLQIKRQECMEMQATIVKTVRQALLGVRRDPLRQPQSLEPIELANAPQALLEARDLFGLQKLTWSDLPQMISGELESAIARYNSSNLTSPSNRPSSMGIGRNYAQMYLKKNIPKSIPILTVADEIKQKQYEIYMLEANHIVHSLERLVIRMAQTRAQTFPQGELRFIRLEDVLARTLNRLPPLYATSSKGLAHLRQYAQMNIGSEVAIIVHESMIEVRNANYQRFNPLMFFKIRHEREQALAKVSHLLLGKDIKWQSLIPELLQALELAKVGQLCWERSPVPVSNSSR